MMKIVGFGTLEQQDDLYEQLKEVALGERVEMKRTFV